MKVAKPPEVLAAPFKAIASRDANKVDAYLDYASPTDTKGRYLHFDQLRHRIPKELDPALVWSVVKSARLRYSRPLLPLVDPIVPARFVLTPTIQKALSETDRNATSASLELTCMRIGERAQLEYLLNDLIEDEAISSSQLEGAATTISVARELLKRNRKPRSPDEKMIVGNYRMMKLAWQKRHEPLTLDLVRELHDTGVEGIDDEHYRPGAFRDCDDVHVVNSAGDIVHTPPPAIGLTKRMQSIIEWVNTEHDSVESPDFLHPLIKAIVLHFCIGYEHPFRDGNGRVARGLFYWYMFRRDFAAFRYIAISVLLKDAPVQYGKSYLYTESDELDLTYFIDYQAGILLRAIERYKEACRAAEKHIEEFNRLLHASGLYKKLSDKQKTVFQAALNNDARTLTIRAVEENLGCSYNTAAAVLNGLVDLDLFEKLKEGREWIYRIKDKDEIMHGWQLDR